ncbi:hypothetical protein FPOAC2_14196 [Fusarium poae]|uniref:uncharacterized protein n=1 Tax=Fusarium poae TaxID=36050 RepID=UPI001D045748|nr:uncharacterized protein FPOAC1_013980 [Fusarium poae]KAG8664273.1 hypothetical protein FPOAC1_013980 [Fusarium poae]
MSEETPTHNYEWIVRFPIHTGGKAGIPVSREQIIQHRERVNQELDFWLCSGVVVERPVTDLHGASLKYAHHIVSAPSKEAVLARLRDDCFYPTHWDVDNAEIEPFIGMVRKALGHLVVDANLTA